MAHPAQKTIQSTVVQRNYIKPSSPVCKRLFDFSDPSVTKSMLQEMENSESRRLKYMWNFDAKLSSSAATGAPKPGENKEVSPMSLKTRRYEWEVQNREKVPNFYSRPFHRHHSESRQVQNIRDRPQITRVQKLFMEPENKPSPLRNRDENVSPGKPSSARRVLSSKKNPKFTSPPKITTVNLNPSFVRLVTALRIPLPSTPQTAPSHSLPTSAHDSTQGTDKPQGCNETNDLTTPNRRDTRKQPELTAHSCCPTQKAPASRELFVTKASRKRSAQDGSTKQLKITDVIPQRKLRHNSSKRRRPSDQSPASVPTSQ